MAPPGPDANGPALSVDRLSKRFGARVAFSDVSFEVARGEVFGFLGPNGAGKTTTVRTLGHAPRTFGGVGTRRRAAAVPENGVEIRRRIAIMPESPGLYLRLTVLENLEFFAGLYEVPGATRPDRAGPRRRQPRRPGREPCGAYPRACASASPWRARCSATRTILFLDEPTSGLDPVAAREVHDLINGLRERGVTVFLTTHRLEEAERLCDRVAILNTTLLTIGRPGRAARAALQPRARPSRIRAPLADPDAVFAGLPGVDRLAVGRRPGLRARGSGRVGRGARGGPRAGRGRRRRALASPRRRTRSRTSTSSSSSRGRRRPAGHEQGAGAACAPSSAKRCASIRRNRFDHLGRWRSCRLSS